jgi:hypothetical protein
MMRDLLNLIDNVLLEKSRGLLYRGKGDNFFQGTKENPTAEIVFDKAEYFPSMPGAYADYNEMATVGQELFKQYPAITWYNSPTGTSKAFALLTFDGPQPGEKTYFGKFFNEIKQDMTGFWKNDQLPGGWQLDKAASLKSSYKLKPSDLFPPDSTFNSPKDIVNTLSKNPTNNPIVPKIVPGMQQLLGGTFPTFQNVENYATAIRDDLGETIGPIALIQGMITTQGAEAARKDILGPEGSYSGSSINFPASKINGLVDSYIYTPSGTEIGISSKGEKGATASVKNISDGIVVARKKDMQDLLSTYADQIKVIDEVGKLSSLDFPLVIGARQGLITKAQADIIRKLISSSATALAQVPMSAEDSAVFANFMKDIKPKSNPRYNVGYHILSSLARKVVTGINQDPKFGDACLKFLNTSPIIQLHMKVSDRDSNVTVTGFDSKYPPNFKGTVGLDASKVYAATGTNGRVTFSYNGGGDTDTDVDVDAAEQEPARLNTADLDAATQKRSRITARAGGVAEDEAEVAKPPRDNVPMFGRKRQR